MMKKTTALRRLLRKRPFVYMPVAYDAAVDKQAKAEAAKFFAEAFQR